MKAIRPCCHGGAAAAVYLPIRRGGAIFPEDGPHSPAIRASSSAQRGNEPRAGTGSLSEFFFGPFLNVVLNGSPQDRNKRQDLPVELGTMLRRLKSRSGPLRVGHSNRYKRVRRDDGLKSSIKRELDRD
jgi:hypothetical protein